MAKKQETLSYMQMPLPQGQNSYKITKVNWQGLNKAQTMDTGVLSAESNISTDDAPYLIPSQARDEVKTGYAKPISMFAFDTFYVVVYRDSTAIKIDYVIGANTYTGTLKASGATSADEIPRSIVKFNVYTYPEGQEGNVLAGSYTKKLLIFPDNKSIDFTISANFTPASMTNVPTLNYATVHLSRVFGVDNDRVYASGFNDYTKWTLDSADETSADNAWVSPAQGNTKANGSFTGITTFMNHVVCFKNDYMHEIYNNKNPFRIQDIYGEGAIDNRSIQDVDGNLIFVSADNVKMYTGGNPRIISLDLNLDKYTKAVSGTDNKKYYLYCQDANANSKLFVYDTRVRQWAEESINFEILSFANNQNGMYCLGANGKVYKLDSGSYTGQVWSCETDLFTGKSIDIKQIRKIQLLADVADDSVLEIYCLYDDEVFNANTSHKVYSYTNSSGVSVKKPVRVVPRQTASYGFKLHIKGVGYCKLYQLELFLQQGGELYV